ncbi:MULTISPECIES: RDD family protein [unclassified Actinomyces]|uniref:RDD family protein n=1 Tax=unclassified Actinomyces TaxID=2609248 RepID=UPI0011BE6190|nr:MULTISPECIES: RDD family protein [unclassified Actinomyces]
MTATSASHRAEGVPTPPLPDPAQAPVTRTPQAPATTLSPPHADAARPAPIRARVLAGLVDLAGGTLAGAVLTTLLHLIGLGSWVIAALLAAVIVLAVREVGLGRTGWSPGGRLMDVRVVNDRNGLPPGVGVLLHADLTFICVAPTLGLGAIALLYTAAADPEGRGWHDRLTGVRMVSVNPHTPDHVPASQPEAVPTSGAGARGPFSEARFAFMPSGGPITQVQDTVDSARASSVPNSRAAIIDSVPWSAVPTALDATTDDAPTAPSGIAVGSAGRSAHAAEPARSETQPAQPSGGTRRRRRTSHRKPEPETVRIRLVPADGGAPITLVSPTVVGRDPDNISAYPQAACVILPDVNRSISKTHAALAPVPGGLWVTDLHSTNGTRVEQQGSVRQVQPEVPAPAPVGSVLILGRASFRVEG